jgi:putative membrane protein
MMWNDDDRWGRMHESGGAGWVMALLMLVIAIAVVVAVVALLRGTIPMTAAPRAGRSTPGPREILQERLARGEIDEQDFRARMRAIDEAGPAGP